MSERDEKRKKGEASPDNSYNANIASFKKAIDITRAPMRAELYSYANGAELPILFRHYHHAHSGGCEYGRTAGNYCRMWIFIEGKFNLIVEDRLYSLSCGDVILIRDGESYESVFYESSNLDYYEIDFPLEFFLKVSDGSPFHTLFYGKGEEDGSRISLGAQAIAKLFGMLEKIEGIIERNQRHSDFLIYSRLIQLAVLVSDASLDAVGGEHKVSETLKEALRYISENYLTLSDTGRIAEHCHISVSYLCRIFKNSLGATPVEYINSQKLARAKYMLKNGYNVTEACYGSGFNSYNYFISTFKRSVGLTPTEYKHSES